MPVAAVSAAGARGSAPPLEASALRATLGNYFSPHTNDAIEASPIQLQAALILGSPEFMHR